MDGKHAIGCDCVFCMQDEARRTRERDHSEAVKRVVRGLEGTMGCNCDLDNWEPEPIFGHSHVCRIYKAAREALGRE